jgi:repressor LexA
MTLDRFLIARPANTVLVRVKGDSMINAGIHSGDLAVVERRSQANPGEVVVNTVSMEEAVQLQGGQAETAAEQD